MSRAAYLGFSDLRTSIPHKNRQAKGGILKIAFGVCSSCSLGDAVVMEGTHKSMVGKVRMKGKHKSTMALLLLTI